MDGMLEAHVDEVKSLLLEKKKEHEESEDAERRAEEVGVRSPSIAGAGIGALRSPKMPPLGYFSVTSPGRR